MYPCVYHESPALAMCHVVEMHTVVNRKGVTHRASTTIKEISGQGEPITHPRPQHRPRYPRPRPAEQP